MKIKKLLVLGLVLCLSFNIVACENKQGSIEPEKVEPSNIGQVEDPEYEPTDTVEEEEEELDLFKLYPIAAKDYYELGYSPRETAGLLFRDYVREQTESIPENVIDLTDSNSFVSIEKDGDDIKGFTLRITDNQNVKFKAEKVVQNEDGSLRILPGGAIYSLEEIDGLILMNMVCQADSQDNILWTDVAFGVSTQNLREISSPDELYYGNYRESDISELYPIYVENFGQFGYFKIDNFNDEAFSIKRFGIKATGEHHGIGEVTLSADNYGRTLEGEYYNPDKEIFDMESNRCYFSLLLRSEFKYSYDYYGNIITNIEEFTVGDLRDKDGNVKAKTEKLALGDTIDVELKGVVYTVPLPVVPQYYPKNFYEADKASVTRSTGDLNVLVVPVRYADQESREEADMEVIIQILGNVVTSDGSEYNAPSGSNYYTLSDYYNQASYGKLNITSYITDWYVIKEGTYEEYWNMNNSVTESIQIQKWVNKNYADWKDILDADSDGIYDSIIFINASSPYHEDSYSTLSFSGAFNYRIYGNYRNQNGEIAINQYVNINVDCIKDDKGIMTGTLLHEFAHGFGLIDYYDVAYSGYNAVGGFDMQSNNEGDWNAYSKYAVGWTNPVVLTEDQIGDGITVEISDFESTGDTLIIPTSSAVMNDGTLCPFNEYISVDLYSPTKLYQNAANRMGLTNTGVRMYHVDSRLLEINTWDDLLTDTITYDVKQTNAYYEGGQYHLQLLQKGGDNTFTSGKYRGVNNKDLFYEGDSFNINDYSSVFANGKMNDGSDFPYEITVISISDGKATISVKPIK